MPGRGKDFLKEPSPSDGPSGPGGATQRRTRGTGERTDQRTDQRIDIPLFSGETPLQTLIHASTALRFMAQFPTSDPDPSKPVLSATGVLRAQPDDTRFEADFAQLASCFAAHTGGSLSPELSSELALEIVLNEVVEQACLTTGATGAAIALERDGEMVCRGSSGSTSPPLGSRLDSASGLSGECIRTRQTQRCDDALADSRADLEASQQLGVRSVMVMPLLRGTELVGLFELFSSLPHAFGERDQRTLEALAGRILSSLERAAQPQPPTPQNEPLPIPEVQQIIPETPENLIPTSSTPENSTPLNSIPEGSIPESSPRSGFDFVTWAFRVAVLVCAVMLGLLLGRHLWTPKVVVRPHPVAPALAAGNRPAAISPSGGASPSGKQEAAAAGQPSPSASAKRNKKPVAPGSLLVFENGKEIFRMPPTQNETAANQAESSSPGLGSGLQRASSAEPEKEAELSPAAAEGSLLHRVEPEYPEFARLQQIQGPVVLQVHIDGDGAVQDVQTISGAAELAQASIDAVKQWRFKPRRVDGRPVAMQTRITLNFKLPR
jgi:TonB family protein